MLRLVSTNHSRIDGIFMKIPEYSDILNANKGNIKQREFARIANLSLSKYIV